MKFIDEAKIFVKSGHGGPGAISWRREKFIPRGGPDGGDGGKGGDVIFESNPNLGTLLDFKFNRRYIAEDGKKGDRQNMTGADGQNIVIPVPVGTIIKNINTGEKIVDLDEPNKRFIF
jgi:GTP-binding protein